MKLSLFSLEGKSALVTGGNGGIGRAIALGLRDAGALVTVTGRNKDKNIAIANELGNSGAVIPLDVRKEEEVEKTMIKVVDQFGRLGVCRTSA